VVGCGREVSQEVVRQMQETTKSRVAIPYSGTLSCADIILPIISYFFSYFFSWTESQ
jgi:hypothetical protein